LFITYYLQQKHLSDARFADDSIYSRSFYQHDVCRAKPVIHPDHIVIAGEFQDETVHKVRLVFLFIIQIKKTLPQKLYFIILLLPTNYGAYIRSKY